MINSIQSSSSDSDNKLLISVVVITYNSSDFVLETLDSIKMQTYDNIELIISDDGSFDNTNSLCQDWISENKDYFKNTQHITVDKNTGIPSNCNRGVRISKGNWIKIVAADDVLYKDAIERTMTYLNQHMQIACLQTRVRFYNDNFEEQNATDIILPSEKDQAFFELNASQQHYKLQTQNLILAPGMFLKKEIIFQVGLFDETFKICEDYPMWLKLTAHNIKIDFADILTIKYRRHAKSVTISSQSDASKHKLKDAYTLQIDIAEKYFKKGIRKKKHILKYKIFKFLRNDIVLNNLNETTIETIKKVIWKTLS